MKRYACLLLLLIAVPTHAQELVIPDKVDAKVGRLTPIKIDSSFASTLWKITPENGDVDVFREYDPSSKSTLLRMIAYRDGTYTLVVAGASGDKQIMRSCVITVGVPLPPPVPPTPPTPPIPPTPVDPAPIPLAGYRVLFIEESSQRDKLTKAQFAAMFGAPMRTWLDSATVKSPLGQPEYRIYDKDQPFGPGAEETGGYKHWQDAMKRRPANFAVPWVVISNGMTGYEGPLPSTAPEIDALLKKYSGGK